MGTRTCEHGHGFSMGVGVGTGRVIHGLPMLCTKQDYPYSCICRNAHYGCSFLQMGLSPPSHLRELPPGGLFLPLLTCRRREMRLWSHFSHLFQGIAEKNRSRAGDNGQTCKVCLQLLFLNLLTTN